ncbi:hypothetical protein [Anaeromyxobacter oryzae]|uniref:hypothetical protein n=1 Tax=Anaeromyxobacter oryzae TaxID=2918170 RepID=UPI0020BF21D9|nr:hypothetical protein [Anaeromyxobacter oryzae]
MLTFAVGRGVVHGAGFATAGPLLRMGGAALRSHLLLTVVRRHDEQPAKRSRLRRGEVEHPEDARVDRRMVKGA